MIVGEYGISIIIPVYNREKYIKDAIDSILNQNFVGPFEIIVVDDGSTDNTVKIINSYNDSRIILILKPNECIKQGASASRNRGLRIASMPYVCFLDSDDYHLPNFLQEMSSFIIQNDLDFCFNRTKQLLENNKVPLIKRWTRNYISLLDIKYLVLTRGNIINTNSFVFRRKIFDDIGYFNEALSSSEDIDLWLRISERYEGGFINFYGTVRRLHSGEQLTKQRDEIIRHSRYLVYKDALNRNKTDRFRQYLINFAILIQKRGNSFFFMKNLFILILKNPFFFIRHSFLLATNIVDKFLPPSDTFMIKNKTKI